MRLGPHKAVLLTWLTRGATLKTALLGLLGPLLVITPAAVLLCLAGLHVHTFHLSPLHAPAARGRALQGRKAPLAHQDPTGPTGRQLSIRSRLEFILFPRGKLAHLPPGPHRPLGTGVAVAEPGIVGPEGFVAPPGLRAGHQALLFPSSAQLGTLGRKRRAVN